MEPNEGRGEAQTLDLFVDNLAELAEHGDALQRPAGPPSDPVVDLFGATNAA
jgi:hypothetical protein